MRHKSWWLLGVGLTVLGALVTVSGLWWFGLLDPKGPRTVSDRAETVSVAIPEGWVDETPCDARQLVPGDSGDGVARVADIVVTTPVDAEDPTPAAVYVYVEVLPEGVQLPTLHAVSKGMSGGFADDAEITPSPVRKWHSLASSAGDASEVVTVRSHLFFVTVVAYGHDREGLDEAEKVIASLDIDDDR